MLGRQFVFYSVLWVTNCQRLRTSDLEVLIDIVNSKSSVLNDLIIQLLLTWQCSLFYIRNFYYRTEQKNCSHFSSVIFSIIQYPNLLKLFNIGTKKFNFIFDLSFVSILEISDHLARQFRKSRLPLFSIKLKIAKR